MNWKALFIVVGILCVIDLVLYVAVRIKRDRDKLKRETTVTLEVKSVGSRHLALVKKATVPPLHAFIIDYDAGLVGKAQIKRVVSPRARSEFMVTRKLHLNVKKHLREQVKGRAIGLVSDNRLVSVYVDGNLYPPPTMWGRFKLYYVDAPGLKIAC
jgi:hypothetical protein